MMAAIRYMWQITAGHRFSPWRSPYVRWRLETYFGKQGDVKSGGEFARLLWRERREMWRFLRWVEERQVEQARRTSSF